VHFVLRDVAVVLQPGEELRPRPHLLAQHGAHALRQHARHVADQAAAGDVREALHRHRLHQFQNRFHVDAGRLHQRIRQPGVRLVLAKDAPDQRVAVGMRAAGGEAQQRVAGLDGPAVDDSVLLDHADAKPGEVVLAFRVHAWHFRGLPADQRAARLLAALGDAADHAHGDRLVELAAGEIIEEEERLGALHEHVVHAHRHQVDADPVVASERECELQLGADAVGAGDEDRLLVLLRDRAQRAEAAQARQHLRAHGAPGERLDRFDERIPGVDVDARVAVGERFRHGR
jgi:hypothetical protein